MLCHQIMEHCLHLTSNVEANILHINVNWQTKCPLKQVYCKAPSWGPYLFYKWSTYGTRGELYWYSMYFHCHCHCMQMTRLLKLRPQKKSWFSSTPSSNFYNNKKKEPRSSVNTQSWETCEMHTFFWYVIFARPHYFSIFFWWEPRHLFFNFKKCFKKIAHPQAFCFKAERSWVQIPARYSGWPSHYNVGCPARLEISVELNPVIEC